jgi:hypothetical protein
MASNCYAAGKKTGMGTTSAMGKKTPSTFSKVSASAGKSSGTRREGDAKGAAPMGGKGK